MQIVDILKAAQQQNSSDIHIAPGNPVMLRYAQEWSCGIAGY